MMFLSSLVISALSLPILLSHASPIDRMRRRQASYSVVPVDGGSLSAAAVTTVTEPAVTLPPTTRVEVTTILSTTVLTEESPPATVVSTITSTAEVTVMKTIATTLPNTYRPAAASTPSQFFTIITISQTGTNAPNYPSPVTVTVTPSSTPYDDGMWHTTYYHPDVVSSTTDSAAATSTSDSAAAASTPAAETLGFWGYNATSYNYTMPISTNFTMPLNWTSPVNYTTTRLRLLR